MKPQAPAPYADGSIRVGGPYTCFVCQASSADQTMDPVYDSSVPDGLHFACHDLLACMDRARANASQTI